LQFPLKEILVGIKHDKSIMESKSSIKK